MSAITVSGIISITSNDFKFVLYDFQDNRIGTLEWDVKYGYSSPDTDWYNLYVSVKDEPVRKLVDDNMDCSKKCFSIYLW